MTNTVVDKSTDNAEPLSICYCYIARLSLDKTSTGLVDSWSRPSDQIQMYPDWDTIPQLLPARDLLLLLLKEKSKL